MTGISILHVFSHHSTWRNAQLGENVIQKLEEKSQKMAQEKQETIGTTTL